MECKRTVPHKDQLAALSPPNKRAFMCAALLDWKSLSQRHKPHQRTLTHRLFLVVLFLSRQRHVGARGPRHNLSSKVTEILQPARGDEHTHFWKCIFHRLTLFSLLVLFYFQCYASVVILFFILNNTYVLFSTCLLFEPT